MKLIGSSKSENHCSFIFPKKQAFFKLIRSFLESLSFDEFEYNSIGRPLDKKWGEPEFDKEEDVKYYIDERTTIGNEEYFIEIIYGKEKIFVSIQTLTDKQEIISKAMSKLVVGFI
jgi:hypothetical protein